MPAYGQVWARTADFSVYDQAWNNQSFGLALQDELSRGDWTWLFGIRFDHLHQVFDYADYLPAPGQQHATQNDDAMTPRLGVSWRATPRLSLYANYSAGNSATLPQSRAFGGSALTPLASRQSETGVKLQPLTGNWLASAAVFDIERSHVLTRDPDHPGFSIQTGLQRSRGLELQWQGRLAPGWRLTAQATWLDAFIAQDKRYEAGNRLPYAPRFGAAAWLTHSFTAGPGERWSLSGGVVLDILPSLKEGDSYGATRSFA